VARRLERAGVAALTATQVKRCLPSGAVRAPSNPSYSVSPKPTTCNRASGLPKYNRNTRSLCPSRANLYGSQHHEDVFLASPALAAHHQSVRGQLDDARSSEDRRWTTGGTNNAHGSLTGRLKDPDPWRHRHGPLVDRVSPPAEHMGVACASRLADQIAEGWKRRTYSQRIFDGLVTAISWRRCPGPEIGSPGRLGAIPLADQPPTRLY